VVKKSLHLSIFIQNFFLFLITDTNDFIQTDDSNYDWILDETPRGEIVNQVYKVEQRS